MVELILHWPDAALMSNFRAIDRETGFLLPPSIDDWVAEKHLARFVVEVVDGLDLSAMIRSYRGSGSAFYHPALLLSVLVYGNATGVFSSRKLERATYDSVAFRYPDHDTIATFRRRFLKDIEGLSVRVLELARREERLAKLAEARAKIETRAKERFEREAAEHRAKLADTVRGGEHRAVDCARPSAASSVLARAVCRCAAGAHKPDTRRGHGLSSADTARQKTLRPAQTDAGTGIRHHQIGDGIPSVPAARARQCPR
jgi:transposase